MPTVTHIGGPTVLIEYGGVRLLTDPTFSPPGEYEGGLVKTTGPAVEPSALGAVDAVLLSHDHHSDNLDPAGRAFLATVPQVLTTSAGAERLGSPATGLPEWATASVGRVTITAVPALHGPPGSEPITGPVIGFVLEAPGAETLYVSGDNASLEIVGRIAERFGSIPRAVLFAGAVQLARRFEGAYLTLSSDLAALATLRLGSERVAVVHTEGWTHFTQGPATVAAAFAGHGITGRLLTLQPGQPEEV